MITRTASVGHTPEVDTSEVKSRIIAEAREVLTMARLHYHQGEQAEAEFWGLYGAALLDLADNKFALEAIANWERINGQ